MVTGLKPVVTGMLIDERWRVAQRVDKIGRGSRWTGVDEAMAGRPIFLTVFPEGPLVDRVLLANQQVSAVMDARFCRVVDGKRTADFGYVVNERVDGSVGLPQLLAAGPLTDPEVAWVSREVAAALATIHRQGRYHCRLSPSVISVTPAGDIRIVGLGIDRALTPRASDSDIADDQLAMDIAGCGGLLYACATATWPGSPIPGLAATPLVDGGMPEAALINPGVGHDLNRLIRQVLDASAPGHSDSAQRLADQLDNFLGDRHPAASLAERVSQLQAQAAAQARAAAKAAETSAQLFGGVAPLGRSTSSSGHSSQLPPGKQVMDGLIHRPRIVPPVPVAAVGSGAAAAMAAGVAAMGNTAGVAASSLGAAGSMAEGSLVSAVDPTVLIPLDDSTASALASYDSSGRLLQSTVMPSDQPSLIGLSRPDDQPSSAPDFDHTEALAQGDESVHRAAAVAPSVNKPWDGQPTGQADPLADDDADQPSPDEPPAAPPRHASGSVKRLHPSVLPDAGGIWSKVSLVVLVLLVLALISAIVIGLNYASAPPAPPASTPAPTPTTYPIVAAAVFDPNADGGDAAENDADSGLAFDGDVTTAWHTELYPANYIPQRKPGVGMWFSLAGPQAVDQVTIDSQQLPATVSIWVPVSGEGAPAEADWPAGIGNWTKVAETTLAAPQSTIRFDQVETKAVLVYFTGLADLGDTSFQGDLAEVSIAGD
ncbi:MAG: hypothetical protein LBV30_04845 [Propionibacteriaceae bacterium]|nr:hypothetical protein [Propionibacteriaceae bacterium]